MRGLMIATLMWGTAAAAQEACVSIGDDVARLACFDTVFASDGSWKLEETIDAMDDATTVVLSVTANSRLSCGTLHRPVLALTCNSQRRVTSLLLIHGCYAPPTTSRSVIAEMRIGSGDASEYWFEVGVDSQTFGRYSDASRLIRSFFGAETLTVRFRPYQDNPVTMVFDINGTEEAVAPLRDACGW